MSYSLTDCQNIAIMLAAVGYSDSDDKDIIETRQEDENEH